MIESGNIQEPASALPSMDSIPTGELYSDIIHLLTQKINNLEKQLRSKEQENNKLYGIIETITKQNSQLVQELKETNTALEFEKARSQQKMIVNTASPSAVGYQTDASAFDGQPTPRVSYRKQPSQPINSDTVARIKNDRRHYAVVCDAAIVYWQRLINQGLVDSNLRATAKCGVTVAARIVCCFQNVVDPNIRWSFFEKHWKMNHLQSNLHRSSYRDETKYALVNRIFGRSNDAPFLVKSKLEEN